ncbi:hypothetical protein V6L77_05990 [Pannonibacter sp. Pt2-lr]
MDGKSAAECRTGTRRVYADGTWHEAGIYERLQLMTGARIEGPAILEQPDTTIFVDPGLAGTADAFGNLIIRPEA